MTVDRCPACRESQHSSCGQLGRDEDTGCRCACTIEARLHGLRDSMCPPDVRATLDRILDRRVELRTGLLSAAEVARATKAGEWGLVALDRREPEDCADCDRIVFMAKVVGLCLLGAGVVALVAWVLA